jgi:hypothetical protein
MKISNLLLALSLLSVSAALSESPDFIPVKADKRVLKTVTLSHLDLSPPNKEVSVGKYQGATDLGKQEATGFFRTAKVDGVWTFIDPEGHPFLSMGVTSIDIKGKRLKEFYQEKFSNSEEWTKQVDAMMSDLGFNTYANWCDMEALKTYPRPYTERVTLIAGYARERGSAKMGYGQYKFENDAMPVFDPGFAVYVDAQLRELANKRADDPMMIGAFSDNELPFGFVDGIIRNYLKAGPDDAGYKRAKQWLEEKGITEAEITAEHDEEFMALVMETYFSTVGKAFKTHLPNHLYLGTRFHGRAFQNDELFKIAGKYVDVVSINYYHRWTPDQAELNKWGTLANKPLMVTEFYAKAVDSGLDNNEGAGFLVETQKDRGRFYENYTLGLLRNPNVVGWHHFRYADDLEAGVECNKGIVDKNFQIYTELGESMKAINKNAYSLRSKLPGMISPLLLNESVTVE